MESDADFGDRPYHGADGPIPVQRLRARGMGPRRRRACRERAPDSATRGARTTTRPTATGVSPYGINARDGARVTTNDAYLEPARERAEPARPRRRHRRPGDRRSGSRRRRAGRASTATGSMCAPRASSCAPARSTHRRSCCARASAPTGRSRGCRSDDGMQEHPLALFWLFPRPDARPGLDARQTNCCLRYSSGLEGAGENDMMIVVGQPDAGPAGRRRLAPRRRTVRRNVGRRRRRPGAGGPGLLCLWANQEFSRGRLGLASPDPDVAPAHRPGLLDDPGDLRRMRDGVKRCAGTGRAPALRRRLRARRASTRPARGLEALSDDAAIDPG